MQNQIIKCQVQFQTSIIPYNERMYDIILFLPSTSLRMLKLILYENLMISFSISIASIWIIIILTIVKSQSSMTLYN